MPHNESIEKEDWETPLGKLVGNLMVHQGVTRPLPNLEAFEQDSKRLVDFIDTILTRQYEAGQSYADNGMKKALDTLYQKHQLELKEARKAGIQEAIDALRLDDIDWEINNGWNEAVDELNTRITKLNSHDTKDN